MNMNYLYTDFLFLRKAKHSRLFSLICSVFLSGLLFTHVSCANTEIEIEIDKIVQQALDANPDVENGKRLYRNCAICHSPEGWGNASGHFPQIAGQHKSVIIKQLTDIHMGNRDNPTMMPFTGPLFLLGAQALADLAEYVSKLPMVPNNSMGYGYQLADAKKLYDDNCKQCHEANGEGKADKFYPRIQGQHFRYLQRQLEWIKNAKRRNSDKKMVKQIQKFDYRELELIADYVSRMIPDKSLVAESMHWKNSDFRSGFYSAPRR